MNPNADVLVLRINDAARALSLGRTSIYKLMGSGKLRSITIAGRVLIPRAEIDRLIAEASK